MALSPLRVPQTEPQHRVLLSGIVNMYKQRILTDCTLIIGHSKLPCHRLVLAASSPYFRAMFTANLSEVNQEEVELHDVAPDAMSEILDYVYSATVNITHDNVQNIFTAASLFDIPHLCNLCSDYMSRELCADNCVTVYQFASFHNCTALKSASRAYVVNHFDEVVESSDLMTLSGDDLEGLFQDDNLNISLEEAVYDCLIRWIEHDLDNRTKHFAKLFKLVRFALVADDFLTDKVMTHELVHSNSYCRGILSAVRLYKVMQETSETPGNSDILVNMESSAIPRLGMYNRSMMVFVGGSQEIGQRALTCFDPKTKKNYYAIPLHVSFDFKYRIDHHRIAVTDNNQIYLVGGIFYEEHHFEEAGTSLREVMTFDAYHKTWIECAPLLTARCGHSLVHLNGRLYVFGGKSSYPAGQALDSAECYVPENNEWHRIASLPHGLCHHGAVTYEGRIYVIGGMMFNGEACNSVLEYDTQVDTWTSHRRTMHTPRAEFGLALLDHNLYVIGGCNSEHKFSTVEIYNFKSDCWKYTEDFPEERKSMATAVYDGCIYVCGGVRTVISRMNRTQRLVETKDLWKLDLRQKIPLWSREVKLVQYANVHACVIAEINTKRVHESEFISR